VPELPEVETICARLARFVEGGRIDDVEIVDSRLTRPHEPGVVAAELVGAEIVALDRRGKYLVFRFSDSRGLLVHLRMTGSFLVGAAAGDSAEAHRRAVVNLDDGSDVAYRDVRRFGTWLLLEPEDVEPYLAVKNGPEPLESDFTTRFLGERLADRRAPVKAALLDQRTAAGLGNIYADEALWYARVHPLRPAGALTSGELRRIHRGVRRALETGIARQGATLRDYRTPEGGAGSMQDEFRAYGRAGEPCPRCGTPIEKTRAAGRGTWFCPACQS
jgi:formamidopyrimidine-DNA glycosylase